MTVGESVARGEAQLRAGPHPDRARRDAETLLLHLIGRNRAWLLSHLDDDFAGCRSIGYAVLLERRFRGEPIQYITGQAEFYGLPLRVTPDVLIPRPETEHLVEEVLKRRAGFSAPRIVDVGTGSGAIALALAHEWPSARVTAIDHSEGALAVARDNARRTGFADRVRFLHGDLLEPVAAEQFEMVVSNPPYVPVTDCDSLAEEVRAYEPALALFAGDEGLDVYRRLIPQARNVLMPGGMLVLEIGFGQAKAVEHLLAETGLSAIEFAPDLQGIPRVVAAQSA
jgi:release factor glutamine methyltransferase